MRRCVLLLLLLPLAAALHAQRSSAPTDSVPSWRLRHKPGRAALYSAILPGAGQVYNRKYWKVPIVAAGLGVSAYFIANNTREYDRYKDAYIALVDNDPATVDEFNGQFSAAAVRDVADTYRRWMDLSYVGLTLVYVLNIVDATVDAHFVRFDVGDDLSLHLRPGLDLAAQRAVGLTLSVGW